MAGRGAPEDSHAPRSDTRPSSRPTIDASKALYESPDSYLDGYIDYIADTLQVDASTTEAQPLDGYVEDTANPTRDMCRSRTAPEHRDRMPALDATQPRQNGIEVLGELGRDQRVADPGSPTA